MPIAVAMMPPSEIGVSKQRVYAVARLQPVGHAEDAAEIADILAEHEHVRDRPPCVTSSALLSAWIMLMRGHSPIASRRCSITRQSGSWNTPSNISFERRLGLAERADRLAFLERGADRLLQLLDQRRMTRLIPFAEQDEMLLQALHADRRVARRWPRRAGR